MKKDSLRISFICAVITVIIISIIGGCVSFIEELRDLDQDIIDAKERVREMQYIQIAYRDLFHKVWVDNPDYVRDSLMNSSDFIFLDNVVDDFEPIMGDD